MKGRGLVLLAFVAAVALAALFVLLRDDSAAPAPVVELPPVAPAPVVDAPSEPAVSEPPELLDDGRRVAPKSEPASASTRPAKPKGRPKIVHVRGRVVDTNGAPCPGLPVASDGAPGASIVETGGDGAFELDIAPGRCLAVASNEWCTLVRHCVVGLSEVPATIVVAPAFDLTGRVVGDLRQPAPGALVWFRFSTTSFPSLSVPITDPAALERRVVTDEDGRFVLEHLPSAPGSVLRISHPTLGDALVPVPVPAVRVLEIELAGANLRARELQGTVVFQDGRPAPDSSVRLGDANRALTDSDGRFTLRFRSDFEDADLIAVHVGRQPAVVEGFGRRAAETSDALAPVKLVLGPPSLAIEGDVEHADGSAAQGWIVALASGQEASSATVPPVFIENLSGSGQLATRTDGAGHFRLDGLRATNYLVFAYDPEHLVLVQGGSHPAGSTNLLLRAPENPSWPLVRGTVTTPGGAPLADVRVSVQVSQRYRTGVWSLAGASAVTDAGGAFELKDVPRQFASISCESESIFPFSMVLEHIEDPDALHLVAKRKCRFQIAVASAEARVADSFECRDARGLPTPMFTPGGGTATRLRIADALGKELATGDEAEVWVLYRGNEELARRTQPLYDAARSFSGALVTTVGL